MLSPERRASLHWQAATHTNTQNTHARRRNTRGHVCTADRSVAQQTDHTPVLSAGAAHTLAVFGFSCTDGIVRTSSGPETGFSFEPGYAPDSCFFFLCVHFLGIPFFSERALTSGLSVAESLWLCSTSTAIREVGLLPDPDLDESFAEPTADLSFLLCCLRVLLHILIPTTLSLIGSSNFDRDKDGPERTRSTEAGLVCVLV